MGPYRSAGWRGAKSESEGTNRSCRSCRDPHLQKCCPTCGSGSRLFSRPPEGSDDTAIGVRVRGEVHCGERRRSPVSRRTPLSCSHSA